MTPVLMPPATFPSPPSAFGARGERVRVRGGYLLRMPPRTLARGGGIGLRASGRPSPSAGKSAGLCPLPRSGGGEGNRAYPLPFRERRPAHLPTAVILGLGPRTDGAASDWPAAGKAARRAPTAATIDAARWVLGTRPRMTPVLSPPATFPSPPSALGAWGERVRVRGGYLLECSQELRCLEVGVGLRASRRPSPSAGKNAGLCPLPRRGGGEGNRARLLPLHSVLKVLTSHFPLRTFFCPLTTHHSPLTTATPPTYPRLPPPCDTALVPLHRGRASKAFWCGGGIGRSGQSIRHAAVQSDDVARLVARRGG